MRLIESTNESMTIYLEMAKRLRSEIASAQKHLTDLNAALAALEPLITFENDDGSHEVKALRYSNRAEAVETQFVEKILVGEPLPAVSAKEPVPATRTRKRRAAATSAGAVEESPGESVPQSPDVEVTPRLPSTTSKFWLSLMGKRAYSIADIVGRAIQRLGVTEEARPVLTNRLSAWLYPSLKAGKIQYGSVKGRTKRYQVAPSNE
jgi:hypothetical protein